MYRLVELPLNGKEGSCAKSLHHFAILVKERDCDRVYALLQEDLAALFEIVVLQMCFRGAFGMIKKPYTAIIVNQFLAIDV